MVFNAFHYPALQEHLNDGIGQVPALEIPDRRFEHSALNHRYYIRNNHYQAGVQFDFVEEPNKVDAVVRDERVLMIDDTVGQSPVWLARQTEMVDVGCFETGAMSDSNQPSVITCFVQAGGF